jgi:hypothetical protein
MGTSCAFMLIKLSNLPLYSFQFFLHMYIYIVVDSLAEDGYLQNI